MAHSPQAGVRLLGKLSLPGTAKSVSVARHWARTLLVGTGHRSIDDALLLLSEIATNAVLHTHSGCPGGRLTVWIGETDTGLIRLEAIDEGSVTVPCQRDLDPDQVGGRGLRLLEELAQEWGYRHLGVGGCLWVHVSRAEATSNAGNIRPRR